jgi:hypothetical protein
MPGATIVLVLCYIVCRTDLYRHRIAGRESAWEAIAPAVDQSPVNPDRTAKLADALVCLAALEEPRCASPPAPTPWPPSNRGRCLTPFQGEARVDQVPPVRLDHGYRFLAASEGSGPQADVVDVMGQRFRKGVDADHPTQAQDPGRRIGNHAAALVVVQEGRQGPKPKP